MKHCILCGKDRGKGWKYCKPCAEQHDKKRRNELSKQRSKEGKRTLYPGICNNCNKEFFGWRKDQKYCSKKCSQLPSTSEFGNVTNNYERGHGNGYSFLHRRIAEEVLGRKLNTNEVIHHIDENVLNSSPNNLIVLSRSAHAKLHHFLRSIRVILEKSRNENPENCWNILRAFLTTTWLETTGVKVIKIGKIGQSAAEPLDCNKKPKRYNLLQKEESSETMHRIPLILGKDIVQTTNLMN